MIGSGNLTVLSGLGSLQRQRQYRFARLVLVEL